MSLFTKAGLLRNGASLFVLCIHASAPAKATITAFDVPKSNATYARDISDGGTITGFYTDRMGVNSGFVRAPDGTITTFKASYKGTFAQSISKGIITGCYVHEDAHHGFVLRQGKFKHFDPNGSENTQPYAINKAGSVVGTFFNPSEAGFLRTADGTILTIRVAIATAALSINDAGSIVGFYREGSGIYPNGGFVRAPDGTITTFDPGGYAYPTGISTIQA